MLTGAIADRRVAQQVRRYEAEEDIQHLRIGVADPHREPLARFHRGTNRFLELREFIGRPVRQLPGTRRPDPNQRAAHEARCIAVGGRRILAIVKAPEPDAVGLVARLAELALPDAPQDHLAGERPVGLLAAGPGLERQVRGGIKPVQCGLGAARTQIRVSPVWPDLEIRRVEPVV